LQATPILKYESKADSLKSFTVQGEKVTANNKVIPYEAGGSFDFGDKIAFKKEMMVSILDVALKATMGKESVDLGSVKVADGVIATEMLVVKDPRAIFVPTANFVRSSASQYQADIKYVINQADVRTSEIKKPEILKLNDFLKSVDTDPKKAIKGIELSAYASPDGPYDLNDKLAGREKNC